MNSQHLLTGMMVLCVATITLDNLQQGQAPPPHEFIAVGLLFFALGMIVDMASPEVGRVAAAFAALITLRVLMVHTDTIVALARGVTGKGQK